MGYIDDKFPEAVNFMYIWTKERTKGRVPLSRGDLIVAKNEYLPQILELARQGGEDNYPKRTAVLALRQFCWGYGLEEYEPYFTF